MYRRRSPIKKRSAPTWQHSINSAKDALYSFSKPTSEQVYKYVCNTASSEKLKAKVQWTVTFVPSDPPPNDVVSYVMQRNTSFTLHKKRGSDTFIQTKTNPQNMTDTIAETDIRLPPSTGQYVTTYTSTVGSKIGRLSYASPLIQSIFRLVWRWLPCLQCLVYSVRAPAWT